MNAASPGPDPATAAVDDWLARLSLRQQVAQLMHPTLTHWDQRIPQARLLAEITENEVGGAFMAGRPYRELLDLAAAAGRDAPVPLIFSGDCECGPNTPSEGVSFGSAMALAAVADLEEAATLAYEAGRVAALQSRACGVRWSFAPVVDINLHPDNPITNVRSYGADPARIIACACAYLRGMQEHGLAATIKHFPGDGLDSRDQHVGTTVNPLDLERWLATFGRVFRAGIEAGTWAVMVGHIALAGVSGRHPRTGQWLPATVDPLVQETLLRGRLGFGGVVVSDAIGMGGMAGHFLRESDQVVANIAAGSDVVLFPTDVRAAIDAVLRAVDEGLISEERIRASARRVLGLKQRVGLLDGGALLPGPDEAARAFADRHEALCLTVAERSVTLVRDQRGAIPLPVPAGGRIVVFELPGESSDLASLAVVDGAAAPSPPTAGQPAARSPLHEELQTLGYRVTTVDKLADYYPAMADADALVYIFRFGLRAGRNSVRLPYNAVQSIDFERVFSLFPCVFASYASPYVLWELPNLPNLICTYAGTAAAQRTLARVLAGRVAAPGKLPVTLPECVPLPDGWLPL